METPLHGVENAITSETLALVAQQAASAAIREFRQDRKLGRADTGKASKIVAQHLKQARRGLGLSQAELADQAGVHPTTIGKIETAERGMSLVTFCRIARVLGEYGDGGFVPDVIAEVAQWGS